MADWFRKAGEIWGEADRALGGWLPGGGTASPITAASQRAQRDLDERVRRRIEMRDAPAGTPGRFADKGQLVNALQATVSAGANPVGLVFGNEDDVSKVASFYRTNPDLQNEYDLNTNLILRYLSGTGAKGLQVDKKVGQQLYSDIKKQEELFRDPEYRDFQINYAGNPSYMKPNILQGNTPVFYGGVSDSPFPHQAQLPTDVGERWQLKNSLGSYWAKPSEENQGYTIDERYNFAYAPVEKEGVKGVKEATQFNPTSPANIGRNLVKSGYGTPFTYSLDVRPSGDVTARPR